MNSIEIIKNKSKETWGSSPAGTSFAKQYQKGTKEFFDTVLEKRFSYECDWLDDIVDFKSFKNKKVLEIGSGAGYDAYMFCKYDAHYTGIDITPDNPIIASQHLGYYGYKPTFICADAEKINFHEEFDYVYSFGVLHHTPDIEKALKNSYHALKRGGEAQIILYHKHSFFYWFSIILTEWLIKKNYKKRTLAEQRSLIEYTESNEKPLVNVYSKREFKKIMKNAGFKIEEIYIRKLVAEDLVTVRFLGKLAKKTPQSILSFIGKFFGWYISIRAVKE
ncbi:MAG: class I SAM-dependent methyltransferase [Candidatus Babeliales bacterium]